jgi:hypothetical protein
VLVTRLWDPALDFLGRHTLKVQKAELPQRLDATVCGNSAVFNGGQLLIFFKDPWLSVARSRELWF